MEEQLEFFGRQMEKRLDALETAAKDEKGATT